MPAVQSDIKFQVRPLHLEVRDALLERINDGRWTPGANLPSEVDLYRQLGVSLGTLRKASGVLESEHVIVREPGRGTFVTKVGCFALLARPASAVVSHGPC